MIKKLFNKKKIPQKHIDELVNILQIVLDHVKLSMNSDWTEMGVDEIQKKLEKSIHNLKNGKHLNAEMLSYMFLPTAPLQETAISNGWSDEYLKLSAKFDELIKYWG